LPINSLGLSIGIQFPYSFSVFPMQLSHRPGSLQFSVRQWVSTTEEWLGGTLRTVAVADVRGMAAPGRRVAVQVAVASIDRSTAASESAIQAEAARLGLIYNAERRLQLAHAINDREKITLIRAELDSLL
jgi:hypothetical protein